MKAHCSRLLSILIVVIVDVSTANAQTMSTKQIDQQFMHALKGDKMSADSLVRVGELIEKESNTLSYTKGVTRGKILKSMGWLYSNRLDSAAGGLLSVISQEQAESPGSFEEGLGHNFLGSVYTKLNNHNRALLEYNLAIEIFREVGNVEYVVTSISNAGTAFGAQNNMIKALEMFVEAQKLTIDVAVPDELRAKILGNLSIVYSRMGKKTEALKFAYASHDLDIKSNNKLGICQSAMSIGNIYARYESNDSALMFFRKVTEAAKDAGPEFNGVALRALNNTAYVYVQQHKLKEAIALLRHSEKVNPVYQIEPIYNTLAESYEKLGRHDSAIYFAHSAIRKAKRSGSKGSIVSAYKVLKNIYHNLNKFDSAYFYQSKQHDYSDSVFNESNRSRFEALTIELATLDKQQEIFAMKKEAQLEKARGTTILVGVVAGAVVVILLLASSILLHKNRQKQQKLRTMALETELAKSNMELRNQALRIIHINNSVKELEDILKNARTTDAGLDIQEALKSLRLNRSVEKEWDSFNEYFSTIHVGFYDKLNQQFQHLSITEKRLAGLVRMNLTNHEIANIMNIEDASVKMAKYRLKKKLNLTDEQNLHQFLMQFIATNELVAPRLIE